MVIITTINGKGGVGKTTTICGLALNAAKRGYRVLALDFDEQGNLSSSLLPSDTVLSRPNLYDLITDSSVQAVECIHSIRDNLDLLPAAPRLRELDHLSGAPFTLREAFDRWHLPHDLVLIDTPGNIASGRLPMSLVASSAYYVPVELRIYTMEALDALQDICERAQGRYYNPELKRLGFVASRVDQIIQTGPKKGLPVKSEQREYYTRLVDAFGKDEYLGTIGRRDPIDQAFSSGRLIEELPQQNDNTRAAAREFGEFAERVFQRARVTRLIAGERETRP